MLSLASTVSLKHAVFVAVYFDSNDSAGYMSVQSLCVISAGQKNLALIDL